MIIDIQDNGLFLEMVPGGTFAFLHSSHIQNKFLGHPGTLGYRPGQEICVKYFGKDPVTGQLQVSRKALMVPPLSESLDDPSEENGRQQQKKIKPVWKGAQNSKSHWWEKEREDENDDEEEEEEGRYYRQRTKSYSKQISKDKWWEDSCG